jgi:hypothetical protein
MQMEPQAHVGIFAVRLLSEMKRLSGSGSDQPELKEVEAVETLLAAMGKSSKYAQLYRDHACYVEHHPFGRFQLLAGAET